MWRTPPGLRGWLTGVNHKTIGLRFMVTALFFLLLGGLLALLMRFQLVVPNNDFLGPDAFNQLFTLHGTTMMFLFAVPIMEGLAMYLLPLLIGTRELPYPRLNAFGYWCYLFGGLLLYSSFLFGTVPDGGWFAYVPLTGSDFSPDAGVDFWLLGVTFVEVSGIIGAIELIVGVLKHRAPGMSLRKMPIFAWSMLVTAVAMLLAFTPLVAASILLEIDRKLGFRVYDAAAGGDSLLWQHLFWWFGHPEVYIMFLPAAGIVSMVIPVFSRRKLLGYGWVAGSMVAIGILSFHLWVHHMFAAGLPLAVMAFFAAASFVIAIPSGIQMFAWIGTLWLGRPRLRTPLLFVLGFLVLFVMGGVTGVMVASIPFDRQVHDTYFVVAHLHYVLVGGVVFPAFAGLHYWFPKMTGRMPSEALGRVAFWTMFIGFNLTFFVQHYLGMVGMPRRVYTYPEDIGWEWPNFISSAGSFLLGIGILVFVVNLAISWRRGVPADPDPWQGATLEWLTESPPPSYDFEQIPVVATRDPLWSTEPGDERMQQASRLVDETSDANRRVVRTSVRDAEPESIVELPGPTWMPLIAALAILVALAAVLVDFVVAAIGGLVLIVATTMVWTWVTGGEGGWFKLDDAEPGRSPGWWGAFLAVISIGMIVLTFAISYLYLWSQGGTEFLPEAGISVAALLVPGAALLLAAAGVWMASTLRSFHPLLATTTVLGAVATVLLTAHLVTAEVMPRSDAFSSLMVVMMVSLIALALLGVGSNIVVQARLVAGSRPGWSEDAFASLRLIWLLVAGYGVIVPVTVFLPQLLGG